MKYYVVLRTWTNIVTCHVYPDEKDDSVNKLATCQTAWVKKRLHHANRYF